MTIITSTAAERIADEILSTYDGKILAISIIDNKAGRGGAGNILRSKSTKSFKKEFGVFQEESKYGGKLAIAALGMVNEIKKICWRS